MKLANSVLVAPAIALLFVTAPAASAGEAIQPGFYSHEPANIGIRISGARSGELCTDASGLDSVCRVATLLTVEGHDSCLGDDDESYPCTRYGYRFDYSGATPDTEIRCHATQNNGVRKREKDYTIAVESDAGSVFHPSWIIYGPVERRAMFTEVHECSYSGALLATIEFIFSYEPSTSPMP